MTLALLLAYEWTRMSLIKECNSIKSDHSHYPVHLVGLWLGRCYVCAHTHTYTSARAHTQAKQDSISHMIMSRKLFFCWKMTRTYCCEHKHLTRRRDCQENCTKRVIYMLLVWGGGQNTQTHLGTIPLEPRLCCTRCFHVAPRQTRARAHTPTHGKIHSVSTLPLYTVPLCY